MRKFAFIALLFSLCSQAATDVKISQLPLGSAATTAPTDSFPYVDSINQITRRLKLSDLVNLPGIGSQYAPIASPTFTGIVTSPSFHGPLVGAVTGSLLGNVTGNVNGNVTGIVSGSLVGNATTATALAANPTDCGAGTYAQSIDASGNLTCAVIPNPSSSSLGGIQSIVGVSHQWVASISTLGIPSLTQPSFPDISGSVAATQMPAFTGDVTTSAGAVATTIAANAVTNAKAAQMNAHTIKGNNTGSTANSIDETVTQVTAELNTFVGDSGSGGTKGLVPAPGAGDAAAGKFLKADGNFSVPAGTAAIAPTHQLFSATGSIVGYVFVIGAVNASATVGATYTNNGHTFTVQSTITNGVNDALFCLGASAPVLTSSTLTKSGGTGDATIAYDSAQGEALYTAHTSPSPLYIHVRLVGAGGTGLGGGSGPGAAGNGQGSYFGFNMLEVGGGQGGRSTGAGGGAGSFTNSFAQILGGVAYGLAVNGGGGQGGMVNTTATLSPSGGVGCSGPFGGGPGSGPGTTAFGTPQGPGSGGSGGGGNTSNNSGGGGGCGAYDDAFINSPSATYYYSIGIGSGNAAAGTGGGLGENGFPGALDIMEHYQ